MSIDPSRFHVATHTPPFRERNESFHDTMSDQLRHAPWLALSIALHGLVALVILLMPHHHGAPAERAFAVAPPEKVEDIVEPKVPEEAPEKEETTDDPVLQDPVEIPEVADAEEPFDDFQALADSPFDSTGWYDAVGLGGGGPGGKFSRRDGGRNGMTGTGRQTSIGIEHALEWLKKHQDEDGRWDSDEFMKHDLEGDPCDGPGNMVHDVGLTGLALLAFLGDGSTMRSGPYKAVVRRGVRWLCDQQDPHTGLFGTDNSNEFVYDHAIATLAMVEAFGLSSYKSLKGYAQRGINYLESHRNPYSVWRYQARDGDNDTSVTGWCVMAYDSAEFFGLDVNQSAMKLCGAWFDQMTDPQTGRCGYTERGGSSSRRAGDHATQFPREKGECMTAVSLLCRFFLGHTQKNDAAMVTQADLILDKLPVWDVEGGAIDHYYWYYASYALYQMGGRHWAEWSKELTRAVVKTQRHDGNFDGSWDPAGVWGGEGGRVYSTAILCLTLEAYYRYTRLVH